MTETEFDLAAIDRTPLSKRLQRQKRIERLFIEAAGLFDRAWRRDRLAFHKVEWALMPRNHAAHELTRKHFEAIYGKRMVDAIVTASIKMTSPDAPSQIQRFNPSLSLEERARAFQLAPAYRTMSTDYQEKLGIHHRPDLVALIRRPHKIFGI